MEQGEIILYQPDEAVKLEVRLEDETVWLTQEQIADLFGTKRPAITKHLNNIYKSGELDVDSTCSILERMGNDGKQRYTTKYYNLDAILSIGYRVNSKNATLFRKWVNIVYKDNKWDYKNANDLRYWPSEALDFYAFNPGTVSEDMLAFYRWEASGTSQKISYTCIDEYGAGTHANYDVMYAIAKGQTKATNNGVVKFKFKHILSQVVFREEVSTFAISSSEQPMSSAPKIAQSITVLFFINKNKSN